jgi:hypothetical protein
MSISSFFTRLGAPLKITRRSWGAQRPSDGAVFLRVWQDLKFIEDGRLHMLVDHRINNSDDTSNAGYNERVRHIQEIRQGAPCFLIMCTAVDPQARPRKIEFFNEDDIFVGADIVEKDGATWIQIVGRKPVSDVIPK